MKKTVFLGALTVAGLAAGVSAAATLDDVKARGKLNCGVTTGLVGFAAPDSNGDWNGFDVAVCRAVERVTESLLRVYAASPSLAPQSLSAPPGPANRGLA